MLSKFGIGQPVPRTEDPMLVRGQGRYADDVNLPGQAYAAMVRSRDAHGVINGDRHRRRRGDAGRARGLYRRRSRAGYGTLKCVPAAEKPRRHADAHTPRPALAADKVRFVGDPVACVVAETAVQAKEAAEAVELDIEPLPAVTRAQRGRQAGRAAAVRRRARQLALDYHYGDADKVAAAFARAAHVTRLALAQHPPGRQRHGAARGRRRHTTPRHERFTFHVGCQGVFGMRAQLADILNIAAGQGARAHRPCRRLVRHEGAGLSGIYLPPARGARCSGVR